MTTIFGGDAVARAVEAALQAVAAGTAPPERRVYDFKEEAGRRDKAGAVLPGRATNEEAARALAPEVACMANTPGGGALILGVADDGTLIGTQLDVDWLQLRLFELLQRKITTVLSEHQIDDARVVVIRCPSAVEPIAVKGRLQWRVGDRCQEVDPSTWHARRAQGWGYDWSNQPSDVPLASVRPEAVALARQFLRDSGDARAEDLADATIPDLLRRLAVVAPGDQLTAAGALVFAGRETPALDYIRRAAPGGDSEARVRTARRSLLEELAEVFQTIRAYNPEAHVDTGLVIGRIRTLPERAVREAVVNGVAHREWTDPAPTFVEHVGATLRVTSPGGFYGGVTSANIINHPPQSRNAALSRVLADLRLAERQGIGVDRMYGDMVRLGYPLPVIEENEGREILAVLAGETPDLGWMHWLREVEPDPRADVRKLMALDRLVRRWWLDADALAPHLQVTAIEAAQVLNQMRHLTLGGEGVTFDIAGVPAGRGPALGLGGSAWEVLSKRLGVSRGRGREAPAAEDVALDYARHMGRISTAELGSILGRQPTNVGSVLKRLERDGLLASSATGESRRGRGHYYRPVLDGGR